MKVNHGVKLAPNSCVSGIYDIFHILGHMAIHKPKTACDFCGKLVSRMKEHLETMHKEDSEMRFRCELGVKYFFNKNVSR